jgi:hypothetical protein
MSESFNQSPLQFSTVEYADKPGSNRCQVCQQPLSGKYYRVNSAMVCSGCAEKMASERALDKHAAYVRALAHGIGAAVVGLIGYALIAILLQGWVISYMSLGVGWLVGAAMIKGSNGVGGRRYQITAALLTYAAVSMAAVPISIYFASERGRQGQTQRQKLEEEQHQLEKEYGQQPSTPKPAPTGKRPQISLENLGRLMGRLILFGLASPFIELSDSPGWGAMGLLILFVGMRIAWRMAAGRAFEVYGPFADTPPASA